MINTIFKFDDWESRIDIMDTVSYDQMLYKFWKPINAKSFYGTDEFLK